MCRELTVLLCADPERHARLAANTVTLYRGYTGPCTGAIFTTQFRRNRGGFARPGIYFAETPQAARRQWPGSSIIMKVEVKLGQQLWIDEEEDHTFTDLALDGYDSVAYASGRHSHFVIYNWDQAEVVGFEASDSTVISPPSNFHFPPVFEVTGGTLDFGAAPAEE